MAVESAKKIINLAKEDEQFMKKLLDNPQEVIKDYDLTDTEKKFFCSADRKAIEGLKDSCFELA